MKTNQLLDLIIGRTNNGVEILKLICAIILSYFLIEIICNAMKYFEIYTEIGGIMMAIATGLFSAKLVCSIDDNITRKDSSDEN